MTEAAVPAVFLTTMATVRCRTRSSLHSFSFNSISLCVLLRCSTPITPERVSHETRYPGLCCLPRLAAPCVLCKPVSARDVELFAAKMNVNLSHAEIARLLSHVSLGREGHVSRSEFTR